jgi:hypothetical protein
MKSHFLRAIALLLVAFYGYMASLTAHPIGHTTDYSISTNAPLFHSGLNAYGCFGEEQNAGLNLVSDGNWASDSAIPVAFDQKIRKISIFQTLELITQFGFEAIASTHINKPILTAQLAKSVRNAGTVRQGTF